MREHWLNVYSRENRGEGEGAYAVVWGVVMLVDGKGKPRGCQGEGALRKEKGVSGVFEYRQKGGELMGCI